MTGLALYGFDVDLGELFYEEFAVFGVHYDLDGCAEHLDSILFEHSLPIEFNSAVECCLSAECEEDALWPLLFYNFFDEVGRYREEVDLVGYAFACLYGGDVWVDEYGLYSFFAECFECL